MKNNKGFTLIEIIVSIAIIGIIAIPIFGIFGTGLKNIVNAGNRTENVYIEQELIDTEINMDYSEINKDNSDEEEELDIKFPYNSVLDLVKIKGKIVTVTNEDDNIEIKTFIPNPNQD